MGFGNTYYDYNNIVLLSSFHYLLYKWCNVQTHLWMPALSQMLCFAKPRTPLAILVFCLVNQCLLWLSDKPLCKSKLECRTRVLSKQIAVDWTTLTTHNQQGFVLNFVLPRSRCSRFQLLAIRLSHWLSNLAWGCLL